jgi:ribosomal protein S6--L-glutamate ligase
MKKLLIVTAEPCNTVPKSLLESAKQLGSEAKIVDITHTILVEGMEGNTPETQKLISKLYLCTPPGEDAAPGTDPTIEELLVDNETVVIPRLNEHHLDIKLSVLKRMTDLGATLLNTVESMDLCNDKLMTHVVLNSARIKSPTTFTFSSSDDDLAATVKLMEERGLLKYPTIIKTLRGTHGIGVMKVDSQASLTSIVQTLQKEQIDFIVQEFIEHEKSARMIMIGENLLAANLRGQPKGKNEFRTNSHLGSETEPYTPGEEEIALGRRIVELFGSKFCAIDYIIKGTELIVLEVNGSPGLENIQKNWPDKDLAGTVVKYVLTGSVDGAINGTQNPVATTPDEETTGTGDIGTMEVPATTEPAASAMPVDAIQEVEPVEIMRVTDGPLEARVDTGAKFSSLHADKVSFDEQWTKFTRGDVTYKVATDRIVKIKNVHGGAPSDRAMVRLDIMIKGKRLNNVEFTINDRANMKYQILIGRNILELVGLPVLVPQTTDNGEAPESDVVRVEEE